MSQFEGEVDENARIAIPSLEKRKEDAKEDLNNNYRGISHEQLKMAHDLFDNEGDTILKGYKKIWGLDDRWKRDPTLNEYAEFELGCLRSLETPLKLELIPNGLLSSL